MDRGVGSSVVDLGLGFGATSSCVEHIAQRSPSEARATDTVFDSRLDACCIANPQPSLLTTRTPLHPDSQARESIDRPNRAGPAPTTHPVRAAAAAAAATKLADALRRSLKGVSYRIVVSIEPPHHQSSHVGRSGGQQQPPTGVRLGAGPDGAAGAGPGGGGSIPSDPLTTDCLRV